MTYIFGLVKLELLNIFSGCFELFMMEFGIDYCLLAIELKDQRIYF